MKRIVLLGILFMALRVYAQAGEELKLFVCYDKTVNIIFPYAVVSEDHGNNGIIVQQRKGAAHILHVKANQKNFPPTSLSVVTGDGHLYSFLVEYVEDVLHMNYIISPRDAVAVTEVPHNEEILERAYRSVANAASNVRRKSADDFFILQITGNVYVSQYALVEDNVFQLYTGSFSRRLY